MWKFIKVLFKRDIYKYFDEDWINVYCFLENNYQPYNKTHYILINLILQRLIPYIEPNADIFHFIRFDMDCVVSKKNFFYYIYPIIEEDIYFDFYLKYRKYLTDQQKCDYMVKLIDTPLDEDVLCDCFEVIIKDIKNKKIRDNAEMLLSLLN